MLAVGVLYFFYHRKKGEGLIIEYGESIEKGFELYDEIENERNLYMEKKYREIVFAYGLNLERAVEELLKYKEEGELVCGEFNGHMLYSDKVTMDSAFIEVTGKPKAAYEKEKEACKEKFKTSVELVEKRNEEQKEELKAEIELTEKKAQEKIPVWIEQGHKVFPEDKWKEWDKIVPIRACDIYYGMELDVTLQIQEILLAKDSRESFEKAKEFLKIQGCNDLSRSLVCAIIKEFCHCGNEFVEYLKLPTTKTGI